MRREKEVLKVLRGCKCLELRARIKDVKWFQVRRLGARIQDFRIRMPG